MSRKAREEKRVTKAARGPSTGLRPRAWAAFAFLFPLLASEGPLLDGMPEYANLFAAGLLAAAMGVWSFWARRRSLLEGMGDPPGLPPLLFVAWAGLSLFWTLSYDHSAYLFTPIGLGGLLYLALNAEHKDALFIKKVIQALVISSAALSLLAMYQVAELQIRVMRGVAPQGIPWDLFLEQAESFRPNSAFKDANTYGSFLSILFPVNLYLVLTAGLRRARWCWIGVLLLNVAGLFCVASRGPAIMVLLSLAAAVAYERRQGRLRSTRIKPLLTGIVLVLAGLVAFQLLFTMVSHHSLLERLIDFREMFGNALTSRLCYWQAAFHSFLDHPVLGTGLNTVQQSIFPYLVQGTFTRFPHNILLQFMAELGLPGALFFTLTVLAAWREGIRKARGEPAVFYVLLACTALVFYACFDITFQCTTVIFLFFLFMGLMGRGSGEGAPGPKGKGSLYRAAGGALTVMVLFGAAFALYESYRVYRTHRDLAAIRDMMATASPSRTEAAFAMSLERPHLLSLKAGADWSLAVHERTGDAAYLDRGISRWTEAYERSGRNPCDAYRIAGIYAEAGRLESALAWYRRALEDYPSSLTIWRAYLQLLERLGRDREVLKRIPALLGAMDQTPRLQAYHTIDRFFLELTLAGLYDRHGFRAEALATYEAMLRRYSHRVFLENLDPLNGKLVRVTLTPYLDYAREQADRLRLSVNGGARRREE